MLCSDNSSKYTNKVFFDYLYKHNIKHLPLLSYTLEYNGVAEHYNHTIIEIIYVILLSVNVTSAF